ncbi:MAG: ThuA domain-containing protein [Planctomycetota bacterium]
MRKALFVWGGWEGHTPRECVDLLAPRLTSHGFDVEIVNTLAVYDDVERLRAQDLIVPAWTMGQLSPEGERALCSAVAAGVGLAGWHAGLCDAFRTNTDFQHMVGGQFAAHPGGVLPSWSVRVVDPGHEITRGIPDFTMRDTERYYLHTDPGNHVLAVSHIEDGGFDMPVAWTRNWGAGRVAYVSIGHTFKDFDVPEALTLVERSMLWAARRQDSQTNVADNP